MRAPDFSDDDLVRALVAAAAELGEPLRVAAYDSWQRGRAEAASPALLVRRFGSWTKACAEAGIATNTTRSTSRRWSDDDVVAVVGEYLASPGATGTFADYAAWAQGREGAPSGATLRQRLPWAEAKRRASTS